MVPVFYFVVDIIVIAIFSKTTAPDAFIISIAILLAGCNIASAISDKTKK